MEDAARHLSICLTLSTWAMPTDVNETTHMLTLRHTLNYLAELGTWRQLMRKRDANRLSQMAGAAKE